MKTLEHFTTIEAWNGTTGAEEERQREATAVLKAQQRLVDDQGVVLLFDGCRLEPVPSAPALHKNLLTVVDKTDEQAERQWLQCIESVPHQPAQRVGV